MSLHLRAGHPLARALPGMLLARRPRLGLARSTLPGRGTLRAYTSIPLSQTWPGSLRPTTVLSGASCTAQRLPSPVHASMPAAGPTSSAPRPITHAAPITRTGHAGDVHACRLARGAAVSPFPLSSPPRPGGRAALRASPAMPRVVRVPRLLFFGGDIVSVTALEALYARLSAIATFALFAREHQKQFAAGLGVHDGDDPHHLDAARVARFVADHLTVICPALPRGMTPEAAAAKYSRQYPVARFCVEHGLPVIPVDHPRSLAKSQLLEDILAHKGGRVCATAHKGGRVCATAHTSETESETPVTWAARGRPLADFDLSVVVSFRYFLPKRLLRALPPVINLHPSLLPRYRGASPIFSTLLHNEPRGGVSVIQMKPDQPGMDSGAILWQCPVPVELDTDIRTYFPLVTQIGAAGLCDLIFGERTVDDLLRTAAAQDPLVSSVVEAMSATNDDRTTTFEPPSNGEATAMPSERLLEVVGANRREGRLRVVSSSPLRSRVRAEWCTLCRAPPQITQSAVQAAAHSHKESFQQNLLLSERQRDEKLGLVKSPSTGGKNGKTRDRTGAAEKVATKAGTDDRPGCTRARRHNNNNNNNSSTGLGSVAPSSLYAKYALTEAVTTSMKCADVFPQSVLNPTCDWPDSFTYSWRFAQDQEYDTFDHFSQDPHHAPLLGKDAAVLRFSQHTDRAAFGVWRAFVGGQYFQPSVNAVLDKGCTPVRNQLVRRGVRRLVRKKQRQAHPRGTEGTTPSLPPHQPHPARSSTAAEPCVSPAHASDGHHDCPCPPKSSHPCELHDAVVAPDMLREAEADLRLACTFTKAIHPDLISDELRAELDAVEAGEQGRFYRAPPPLFASVRHPRDPDGVGAFTVTSIAASLDVSPEQHALVLLKCRRREAAMARDGPRGAALVAGLAARTEAASVGVTEMDDESADDVSAEAPHDFLPDVIHASPPAELASTDSRRCVHIPPGTAYFPVTCEDIGAVKCKQGWLLWKEAHLRSSAQAQPVALLRKGLAMKTGLLYPGMFSEYLR